MDYELIDLALCCIRMRRILDTGHEEAFGNPRIEKPSVKPVGKFLQIQWSSGTDAPVVCAVNEGLGIADDDIDPVEHGMGIRVAAQGDLVVGLRGTGVDSRHVSLAYPEIFEVPSYQFFDGRYAQIRHRF